MEVHAKETWPRATVVRHWHRMGATKNGKAWPLLSIIPNWKKKKKSTVPTKLA